MTIAANGSTPACAGNETTPCVAACPDGVATCYNFYQYRGYGPDGVGPGNYGASYGGCFNVIYEKDLYNTNGKGCRKIKVRHDGYIYIYIYIYILREIEQYAKRMDCCESSRCNANPSFSVRSDPLYPNSGVPAAPKLSAVGAGLAVLWRASIS